MARPCDDLEARFDDIGWCDERGSGDAGDGTSSEKCQGVVVTTKTEMNCKIVTELFQFANLPVLVGE